MALIRPLLIACFVLACQHAPHALAQPQTPPDERPADDVKRGLILSTEAAATGYTLFAPLNSTTTYLIDIRGETVHSWPSEYNPGQAVYVLDDGRLLRCERQPRNRHFHGGGIGGRVERISPDGKVEWEFVYANEEHCLHHDVEPLRNGNILMIAWETGRVVRYDQAPVDIDPVRSIFRHIIRNSCRGCRALTIKVVVVGLQKHSAPVCDRYPSANKRVQHLHVRIFREPFADVGYDHDSNPMTPPIGTGNDLFDYTDTNMNGEHDSGELSEPFTDVFPDSRRHGVTDSAYVLTQLSRAKTVWSQCCISVVIDGVVEIVESPGNILNDTGYYEGGLDTPEEVTVLSAYNPLATPTVLEVIYAPLDPGMGANAYTTIGMRSMVALGDNYFAFINISLDPNYFTLGHEIGHALTNTFDSSYDYPNLPYVVYPASSTYLGNSVNQYRRLLHHTETYSRTVRSARFPIAPPPAATTGNLMLQTS